MNPFVRCSTAATTIYDALLGLSSEERGREDFSSRCNLLAYVRWYAQSGAADRVREHITLLDRALRVVTPIVRRPGVSTSGVQQRARSSSRMPTSRRTIPSSTGGATSLLNRWPSSPRNPTQHRAV